MNYQKPEVYKDSFHCPNCGVLAQQIWRSSYWDGSADYGNQGMYKIKKSELCELRYSQCQHCKEGTIWIKEKMVYPDNGGVTQPNMDMPKNVKEIYLEAASIYSKSPRGAAALLRLGIQLLCIELGCKGKKIDDDIASLVAKGLPGIVQQSLDSIRVIGNEAVHPGQIDTDDPIIVMKLFDSMNLIIDYMITLPNRSKQLYDSLPEGKLKYINKRDGKS